MLLDPSQQDLLPRRAGAAEVGEVGYNRELVGFVDGKILGVHDLRDAQVFFGEGHCILDILEGVTGVDRGPVGNEPGLAVVHKSGEAYAIIPVSGEVCDIPAGQDDPDPVQELVLLSPSGDVVV